MISYSLYLFNSDKTKEQVDLDFTGIDHELVVFNLSSFDSNPNSSLPYRLLKGYLEQSLTILDDRVPFGQFFINLQVVDIFNWMLRDSSIDDRDRMIAIDYVTKLVNVIEENLPYLSEWGITSPITRDNIINFLQDNIHNCSKSLSENSFDGPGLFEIIRRVPLPPLRHLWGNTGYSILASFEGSYMLAVPSIQSRTIIRDRIQPYKPHTTIII